MYAHIYGSKARGFTLYVTQGPELIDEKPQGTYASKAQAMQASRQLGLTAWNF